MMFPTYEYELVSRWFGLQRRAEYVESGSGSVEWTGPWRFLQNSVLMDIMEHSFEDFRKVFFSESDDDEDDSSI